NVAHPFQSSTPLCRTPRRNFELAKIVPDHAWNFPPAPARTRGAPHHARAYQGRTGEPVVALRSLGALARKMFRVPVGLEIGADFGIDNKDAGRAVAHPGAERLEVAQRPHGCGPAAEAPPDCGKIGVRKLDDVDGIALPTVKVHLGGVGAVIVNE